MPPAPVGVFVRILIGGAVAASIALVIDPSHPVIGDYGQGLRQRTPPPLREHTTGAPPDWAIELVPAPYPADGNQISITTPGPAG
jgi:hypothetical protein